MKLLTPERMALYDDFAIRTWGMPSAVLMENAGRNTYRLMEEEGHLQGRQTVAVVCGRGNNGGDGFVIARYALRDGFDTRVYLLGRLDDLKGDAALNMRLYQGIGGEVVEIADDPGILRDAISGTDIIVDAIFGTGLAKDVQGRERDAIELINNAGKRVVAVDIPSGVDGKTGAVRGVAVRADHTYTFGYPKVGQVLYPGAAHTGRLTVIDISLPMTAEAHLGIDGNLVDGEMIRGFFRERLPWSHKGTYGHVAVVAGSPGKTGAAYMAATAALKIGAGLVTLLTPQSLNAIMEAKTTEVMTHPVPDEGTGFFRTSSFDVVMDFLSDKDVLIMGPGLSQEPETMEFVRRVFRAFDNPCVLDADGINAFQGDPASLKGRTAPSVLTPHPGELARIIGSTPGAINNDRIGIGKRFVETFGKSLLLKGARSIYFDVNGEIYVIPTGNPSLAKGGSGDILTGFIGGLVSQGYSVDEGALFGAYLHGYIADGWAEEQTEMDLVASDLLTGLGKSIRDIRNGSDRAYIEKCL